MGDDLNRFLRFVNKTSACWLWTGGTAKGYGHFKFRTKTVKAHRFSYEVHVGPIPEGLQIDHLCRTPLCVNPLHLEPVTAKENTLRGNTIQARNKAKTHCMRGHLFSEDNIYRTKDNGRCCKKCTSAKAKKYSDTDAYRAYHLKWYHDHKIKREIINV